MVYESDFYTTRRPYSTRPTVTSYSVTRNRLTPAVGRAHTYHSSIPYIAHKRLNKLTTPVPHNQVRKSVIRGALDYIQHRPRSLQSYDAMEDFLNERSVTSFDDVSRSIRAHTAALLKQVHAPVPRAIKPLGVVNTYNNYTDTPISERISSDEYILHLLRPLPGKPSNGLDISYYPESANRLPLGKTHLACMTYAGGHAIPRRRHLMVSGDNDYRNVRSDVELLSHYHKMRLAANSPRQNGHDVVRGVKRTVEHQATPPPVPRSLRKEEDHTDHSSYQNLENIKSNGDLHHDSEADKENPYDDLEEDKENIASFTIKKKTSLKAKKPSQDASFDEPEQDNRRLSLKKTKRASKDVSFDESSIAEQEKQRKEKLEAEQKELEEERKLLEKLEAEQREIEEQERKLLEEQLAEEKRKEQKRLARAKAEEERLALEKQKQEEEQKQLAKAKAEEERLALEKQKQEEEEEEEQRLLEEKLAEEYKKEQERLKKEQELEEQLAEEYRREQEQKVEQQRRLQEKLSEERIAIEQKELEEKLIKIKQDQERSEQEQNEELVEGRANEDAIKEDEFDITEHYESSKQSTQKQKSGDETEESYYEEKEIKVSVRKRVINDGFDWGSMEIEETQDSHKIEEIKDYESDEEPAVAETLDEKKSVSMDKSEDEHNISGRRDSTRSQISNAETEKSKKSDFSGISNDTTEKDKNVSKMNHTDAESELSENEVEPIIDEPITPQMSRHRMHQDTMDITEITSDEEA